MTSPVHNQTRTSSKLYDLKLLDEFMPYIKTFIKKELKFSKQENDLVNSNTEIIKSLEKELEFLKQEIVNKNKLAEL